MKSSPINAEPGGNSPGWSPIESVEAAEIVSTEFDFASIWHRSGNTLVNDMENEIWLHKKITSKIG